MLTAAPVLARRVAAGLRRFFRARDGSTAIEYTIIAGLVSVAIVASFGSITAPLAQLFADISTNFAVN